MASFFRFQAALSRLESCPSHWRPLPESWRPHFSPQSKPKPRQTPVPARHRPLRTRDLGSTQQTIQLLAPTWVSLQFLRSLMGNLKLPSRGLLSFLFEYVHDHDTSPNGSNIHGPGNAGFPSHAHFPKRTFQVLYVRLPNPFQAMFESTPISFESWPVYPVAYDPAAP